MFSARTGWPLAPNRLHRLALEKRRAGSLLDLTASNPTACGFLYPRDALLAALGHAASLRYEPQPLGLAGARAAVSGYYAERGVAVPLERILLTASTSEAYSHLFRLLCDPGDGVLMPSPSYPLFELLAGVNDVQLVAAPMFYDHGWHLDLAGIDRRGPQRGFAARPAYAQAGPATRAVLLVHPNNPAGSYLKPDEWARVQELARERGWAVIVDEVFFDYAIAPHSPVELDVSHCPALTFVLNGFSKIAGLPQMKLGWIAVHGPEALRHTALERLEMINDLYLSVDAPIQHAAPAVLASRRGIQRQIRERVAGNLATLDAALAGCPAAERLVAEGGWSAVLRLPRIHSDEAWAELLVERVGVLTHPGCFYGFAGDGYLVVSLLGEEFGAGVERILGFVGEEAR